MPSTEFEFCSSNIHMIIISLLIFCISLFFYIELKKINIRLTIVEKTLNITNTENNNNQTFIDKIMNPLTKYRISSKQQLHIIQ